MATEPTLVGVDPTPEAAAVQALYERHARRVYGFCLNQLGSREEAEDATQSTFLNAFRALRRGVTPVAESAWLLSIAQNVCLTRLRSSVRRRRVEAPRDLQALQDEVPALPRDGFDELLRLEDALTELPASQRRAILLREWQGLSYREIAAELETSQAAVETLIFRARHALAERLEESPRRKLARWVDLGSAVGWLQGLLAGGTAKAVATAVTVTTVALGGAAPLRHDAPPPAEAAPAAQRESRAVDVQSKVRPAVAVRVLAPVPAASSRAAVRPKPKPAPPRRAARVQPPAVTPAAAPRENPHRELAAARRVERAEEQAARRVQRDEQKAARIAERSAARAEPPGRGRGAAGEKQVKEEKEPNSPGPRRAS